MIADQVTALLLVATRGGGEQMQGARAARGGRADPHPARDRGREDEGEAHGGRESADASDRDEPST